MEAKELVENNSEYFKLSHKVSNLVYHIVCPAKYRRVVFDNSVEDHLKNNCLGIEERYEYIHFLEVGVDKDHVHFLIQSLPTKSPTELVTVIKSVIARQIFLRVPQVKKKLWGGEFFTDRYFATTVGRNQNETVIKEYVKNQGKQDSEYKQIHLALK